MGINVFAALFQHGLLGWHDQIASNPLGQLKKTNFNQILSEIEKVYLCGGEQGEIKWAPPYLIERKREIIEKEQHWLTSNNRS
jgi:hypothetical protein